GEWMVGRARKMAGRVANEALSSEPAEIDRIYRLVYGRAPSAAEAQTALQFFHEQRQRSGGVGGDASAGESSLLLAMPQRESNAAVFDPEAPDAALRVPD